MEFRELGEIELHYRRKGEKPPPAKFGSYLGQGDGTIAGPVVSGGIVWDLFEDQAETGCEAHFVGRITTPDHASIDFDVIGFFTPAKEPKKWSLSAAIRFQTHDPRYRSLDNCLGTIVGEFDMVTYTHRYVVYASGGDHEESTI